MRIQGSAPSGAAIVCAVLLRPGLWRTAVGVLVSHRARAGMGKGPRRPRLAREYLKFRMETQYGDARDVTAADASDVLKYLEWVKQWKVER